MRRRTLLALVMLVLVVPAACGDDEGGISLPSITRPGAAQPPATEPPATEPPATAPPETAPPATAPPETAPPETASPETAPPATEPPATAPPETAPPETAPPATEPPVVEPPVTGPPAVEPPVTGPPAEEEDGGGTGWLPWVLLLAVLAVGGLALLLRRPKAAAVPTPPWPDRAARLVEDTDLQSVQLAALTPDGLRVAAAAHAARLAELTVGLEELLAAAPDVESQQVLAQLQGPLGQLYASVDAVALMPAGPTPEAAEWVRASAAGLHTVVTTTRLRLRLAPPSPDPGP